jgi:nicotinamide-nucleotide amidase
MERGISIIAIGDEVLHGVITNTNAACIAEALSQLGYLPVSHVVTSDAPDDISEVITRELLAGRDVITTGGLGPTVDDNTKAVVAKIFSRSLVRNDGLFSELASRYGGHFPTLENQSLQPQNAVIFRNHVGTAPGLLLEDDRSFPGARLFVLPGPPHEMKDVFFQEVLPRFFKRKTTLCRTLCFIGLSEHEIDPLLRALQQQHPQIHVGIYPSYGIIRVHLSASEGLGLTSFEHAIASFCAAFSKYVCIEHDTTLEGTLHSLLLDRGWKIATAESCTGGGLAARLTSVPGASEVVSGGVIAYQDFVKKTLLGVPEGIVEKYGAVSTEVTERMARGVEALFGAQVVCAVSGFFGPTGGMSTAPIGTVCASFLMPHGIMSERFFFYGTRESICEKTIQTLLVKLIIYLERAKAL